MTINHIYEGDCLNVLRGFPENSIDSIVTDPPYGLSFMGKKWDYDVPSVEIWQECLRVLKPGGHLLAFAGTRTQHRMAVRIEDAGFEIRDMIAWIYGSGFPKSLNIGKSVNQLETNEWSKIGKALDNIDQKSIIEIWKSNSNNVKIVETQSLKNQIIVGQDTLSENFVVLNVVQNSNQENSNLLVSFAEQNLNEVQAINTKINTALPSVEAEIRQLQDNVKSAEQQSQNQNHKSWSIFTAQCDVKEWLKENTMVNHKVDVALKTLRGNKKYSNEEITSVLCAGLTDILKLTILSQSNTFQNLDTKSQTDFLSATNVIITEYTAENLISNTVAILKSKAVDKLQGNERIPTGEIKHHAQKGVAIAEERGAIGGGAFGQAKDELITKGTSEWEGWGTALKPALEPITVARKPLAEKTVAENCLKWGTGGINIDESRVGTEVLPEQKAGQAQIGTFERHDMVTPRRVGRFPANLIHDGSEEVRECFPETKSGWTNNDKQKSNSMFLGEMDYTGNHYAANSGNASRFFYCAKASKSERNEGCEGLEKEVMGMNFGGELNGDGKKVNITANKNHHPTVKPIALMEYLVKLVTPKGGIVCDPFTGSGSTLIAAEKLGFNYIGIELNPEYIEIAQKRLSVIQPRLSM